MLAVILSVTVVARSATVPSPSSSAASSSSPSPTSAFAYSTATGRLRQRQPPRRGPGSPGSWPSRSPPVPTEATWPTSTSPGPQWLAEVMTHLPILAVGCLAGRPAGRSGRSSHRRDRRPGHRRGGPQRRPPPGRQPPERHADPGPGRAGRRPPGGAGAHPPGHRRGPRPLRRAGPRRAGHGLERPRPSRSSAGPVDQIVGRPHRRHRPRRRTARPPRERIARFVETGDPDVWDDGHRRPLPPSRRHRGARRHRRLAHGLRRRLPHPRLRLGHQRAASPSRS